METKATLGDRVYAKRVASGKPRKPLSVRAAALQAGVHYTSLSRVENGKDVAASVYLALCRWVGICANELPEVVAKEGEAGK